MPAVTGYNPRMISAKNSEGIDHAGTVKPFNGQLTMIPAGWVICDGSTLSRTTYAALFAALGISAGQGDGSTTFTLPDMRGRFLRGVNGGAVNDPDAITRLANTTGGNTGNNVNTIQSDQTRTHVHGPAPGYSSILFAGAGPHGLFGSPNFQAVSSGVTNTGATGGNETRPNNFSTYYIIKT